MRTKAIIIAAVLVLNSWLLQGQTPSKEAMNNFALFTEKQDFNKLKQAKQLIDNGYKTKKDTFSYRNNLVRGLVYSTLAHIDSNRTVSYVKDPIDETLFSLAKLRNRKLNDEHETEINYIRRQLASSFLIRANRSLKEYDYEKAYDSYRWVDSLNSNSEPLVLHNLAVLSQRMGYRSRAIGYYEQLIRNKETTLPSYYLALSSFYETEGDIKKSLEVIREGRKDFPNNEDLLFKELNTYADNGEYEAVLSLIDEALGLQPENLSLNYLAAFSYNITGKPHLAEKYYKKIISIEPNNYDSNYSLGLLYLNSAINGREEVKESNLQNANTYLNKALEIDPNATNALKSLSILYEITGDMIKLERVNNKLNQIILK
jgi:tetratricopeptide (TPR) repeat protein